MEYCELKIERREQMLFWYCFIFFIAQ